MNAFVIDPARSLLAAAAAAIGVAPKPEPYPEPDPILNDIRLGLFHIEGAINSAYRKLENEPRVHQQPDRSVVLDHIFNSAYDPPKNERGANRQLHWDNDRDHIFRQLDAMMFDHRNLAREYEELFLRERERAMRALPESVFWREHAQSLLDRVNTLRSQADEIPPLEA